MRSGTSSLQLATAAAMLLAISGPAAASDAVSLELEEVMILGTNEPGIASVVDGKIEVAMPEGVITYSWASPPKSVGPGGIDIRLTANGESRGGEVFVGTGLQSNTFTFEPDPPGFNFWIAPHQAKGDTQRFHATPMEGLTVGSTIGLSVNGSGATVVYRYRVKAGGRPQGLVVTEDCPETIEISALPSMLCHLIIDGFRRNTADPVEVILPDVVDTFGNHASGIQVLAAGAVDPANWDYPRFWDMLVFACPSQDNAGANCYGSVTTPGTVTVNIIVRQKGLADVLVPLTFTAVPHS